eukprot:Opistho-2@87351
MEGELKEARRAMDVEKAESAKARGDVLRMEGELKEARRAMDVEKAESAKARGDVLRMEGELKEVRRKLDVDTAEGSRVRAELDRLARSITDANAKAASLEADLSKARLLVDAEKKKVADVESRHATELQRAKAEMDALAAELSRTKASRDAEATKAKGDSDVELVRVRGECAVAKAEAAQIRGELSKARDELQKSRDELQKVTARVSQQQQKGEDGEGATGLRLRKQLADALSQCEASKRAALEAEERAKFLQAESGRLSKEVADVRKELKDAKASGAAVPSAVPAPHVTAGNNASDSRVLKLTAELEDARNKYAAQSQKLAQLEKMRDVFERQAAKRATIMSMRQSVMAGKGIDAIGSGDLKALHDIGKMDPAQRRTLIVQAKRQSMAMGGNRQSRIGQDGLVGKMEVILHEVDNLTKDIKEGEAALIEMERINMELERDAEMKGRLTSESGKYFKQLSVATDNLVRKLETVTRTFQQ